MDSIGDVAPTGHWVAEEDSPTSPRLLAFLPDDHATPQARNAMATA